MFGMNCQSKMSRQIAAFPVKVYENLHVMDYFGAFRGRIMKQIIGMLCLDFMVLTLR